jgi:hypothetical protein
VGSRVEQFEQIRRDRAREGLSIRALAARHGVHRRAVRQAWASPLPPLKRVAVGRSAPKLGPYRALIDSWLEADRDAPRKQRHTAKRVHRRLVDEHGADVAEVTVRQHVRQRRRELGWAVGEVFVPQVHAPGREAEVDWGQAEVVLGGVATRVHLFVMRRGLSPRTSAAGRDSWRMSSWTAATARSSRARLRRRRDRLNQPLRDQAAAEESDERALEFVRRALGDFDIECFV